MQRFKVSKRSQRGKSAETGGGCLKARQGAVNRRLSPRESRVASHLNGAYSQARRKGHAEGGMGLELELPNQLLVKCILDRRARFNITAVEKKQEVRSW